LSTRKNCLFISDLFISEEMSRKVDNISAEKTVPIQFHNIRQPQDLALLLVSQKSTQYLGCHFDSDLRWGIMLAMYVGG
ncbi:hypothetical protein WA026_006011, partial [Henosepilachna vigintioctopunctata]